MLRTFALPLVSLGLTLSLAACSSSSSGGNGGGSGGTDLTFSTTAAVKGDENARCDGVPAQPTSQSECHITASGDGGGGGGDVPDYGETLYGSKGADDDCKYEVSWQSTEVAQNKDVTFQVVGTSLTDQSAVTGAAIYAEAFLDEHHGAPYIKQTVKEDPKGTYTLGPIQFDKAGKWTVRFHFFEDCTDVSDESPHGHAAFYVQVP